MYSGMKQAKGVLLAAALCSFSYSALAQSEGEAAAEAAGAAAAEAAVAADATITAPSSEPTVVYVIRESKFFGGGRDIWMAVNDKVVADVSNGTHVKLTLQPGLNTLNGVQAKAGFAYTTVDNRGGETVYLRVDIMTGAISEVSQEEGIALVKDTKASQPLDALRPNDAYDNLMVNPELLGLGLVQANAAKLEPDAESAIVTFYRPAKLIAQVPFSVWSKDGYVGSLYGNQYQQVRVAPGKHTFVGLSERLSVLNATVEAGKEYAVEFDVGMGWNQAHIKLLPVDLNTEAAKVDGWKAKLAPVGVNAAVLETPAVAPRLAAGVEYLKSIESKWGTEEAESRTLAESAGR